MSSLREKAVQEGLSVKDQLSILSERLRHRPWKIGIDGQAAAGKGAAAENLFKLLGIDKIETGRMYRAITYWLIYYRGVRDPDFCTDQELRDDLHGFILDFVDNENGKKRVIINHPQFTDPDNDITEELENPFIGLIVPRIAKRHPVRDFLDKQQIALLKKGNAVIEGRDMWNVARRHVDMLVYLYADDETLMGREKKRQEERGKPITDGIARRIVVGRNQEDYTRSRGKLLTPGEAKQRKEYDLVIDTSILTPDEIVLQILLKLDEIDQRKRPSFIKRLLSHH